MESPSKNFKQIITKSFKSFFAILPMMFAVIGLVGLFQSTFTTAMIHTVFNGNMWYDSIIGTLIGAVSVGQPFFSYIIGSELLNEGVSIYGVTAFIIAWVTLGFIQLPLEYSFFGARFTIVRNLLNLLFSLLVAIATGLTLSFFI